MYKYIVKIKVCSIKYVYNLHNTVRSNGYIFKFLPEHLVVRALGDLHGLVFNNASDPIKTIN